MSTEAYRGAWRSYQDSISQLYQDDVRSLIATNERTEVAAVAQEAEADSALESSEILAATIADRLATADPYDRQLVQAQLVAGASVDGVRHAVKTAVA